MGLFPVHYMQKHTHRNRLYLYLHIYRYGRLTYIPENFTSSQLVHPYTQVLDTQPSGEHLEMSAENRTKILAGLLDAAFKVN